MPFQIEQKAIPMGRDGLVATIPQLWRKKQGLKVGDVLLIEISEDELVIRPKRAGKK